MTICARTTLKNIGGDLMSSLLGITECSGACSSTQRGAGRRHTIRSSKRIAVPTKKSPAVMIEERLHDELRLSMGNRSLRFGRIEPQTVASTAMLLHRDRFKSRTPLARSVTIRALHHDIALRCFDPVGIEVGCVRELEVRPLDQLAFAESPSRDLPIGRCQ